MTQATNTTKTPWLDKPVISQETADSIGSTCGKIGSGLGYVYNGITDNFLWRHTVGRASCMLRIFPYLAGTVILSGKIALEYLLVPISKLEDKQQPNKLQESLKQRTVKPTFADAYKGDKKVADGRPVTEADINKWLGDGEYHEKHIRRQINDDITALKALNIKALKSFAAVFVSPPKDYVSLYEACETTVSLCTFGATDSPSQKDVAVKIQNNAILPNKREPTCDTDGYTTEESDWSEIGK